MKSQCSFLQGQCASLQVASGPLSLQFSVCSKLSCCDRWSGGVILVFKLSTEAGGDGREQLDTSCGCHSPLGYRFSTEGCFRAQNLFWCKSSTLEYVCNKEKSASEHELSAAASDVVAAYPSNEGLEDQVILHH